jgi:glycogen(starch) synthase
MRDLTHRPQRVYVVCTEVPPDLVGGLGRYAERLMTALAHLGTPVEVFGVSQRHPSRRTEHMGAVTLHRIRAFGVNLASESTSPKVAQYLIRIVGMLIFNVRVAAHILRADAGRTGSVVAVHDWMGCVAGILCRLLGRVPVVFHIHTRELNDAPRQRRSMVAACIAALEVVQVRLAALIVVPSMGMRDSLVARGWPADRMRVVPHGVEVAELARLARLTDDDRDRLRSKTRRRYLDAEPGRLIVFAGRLAPHKGVLTLIRAAPRVIKEHDDVRIVLIGAASPLTDERGQVAGLIDTLGVAGHVFADYRFLDSPELFAHLLAADVCAFPSTYEPFGLVAIESMALGRPVVVGPGYSPEVVGDGAIRYGHDSPDELADALLWCLNDPAAAARLALRGSAHVNACHSWTKTAEQTLATYAEAAR